MWGGARWRSSQCKGGGSYQGKATGGVVRGCVSMVIDMLKLLVVWGWTRWLREYGYGGHLSGSLCGGASQA